MKRRGSDEEGVRPPGSRRRKYMRRAAVGASVVGISVGGAGEYYASDPLIGPEVGIGYLFDDECAETSNETVERVRAELAKPIHPELKRIDEVFDRELEAEIQENLKREPVPGGPLLDLDRPSAALEHFEEQYRAFAWDQAGEAGLTLVNGEPYTQRIEAAKSIEEVLDTLSDFTEHFGFEVTIHDDTDPRDIAMKVTPLQEEDLDLEKFKKGAGVIVDSLYFMPVELAEYIDMRELRLVKSFGERDHPVTGRHGAAGEANPITGIFYYDLKSLYEKGYDLLMHELAHRLDYILCGIWGAVRDREYSDLNTDGFEYGDRDNPELKQNVIEAYQANNPMEDKAVLSEGLLNGMDADLFRHDKQVVREKFVLLLARLEEKVPGILAYLSAISDRRTDEELFSEATD